MRKVYGSSWKHVDNITYHAHVIDTSIARTSSMFLEMYNMHRHTWKDNAWPWTTTHSSLDNLPCLLTYIVSPGTRPQTSDSLSLVLKINLRVSRHAVPPQAHAHRSLTHCPITNIHVCQHATPLRLDILGQPHSHGLPNIQPCPFYQSRYVRWTLVPKSVLTGYSESMARSLGEATP